jgi:hypothetical protein
MTTGEYGRWAKVIALPLVAGALLAGVLAAGEGAGAQAAAQKRTIASTTSNGFRVLLTAVREPRAGARPDTATVRIAAFRSSGGDWQRLGRPLTVGLRSGWFWNVVSRPYGVRELSVTHPGGRFPRRIAVRLLVSPSAGPSATYRFVIDRGRLVQVDV